MANTKEQKTPANVAVENQNTNPVNAASVQPETVPTETVDETQEPENTPEPEKTVISKEYHPTLKEGVKAVENPDAPAWMTAIGTATLTAKYPDACSGGQTLYTGTVETDAAIYNFMLASSTQIKALCGHASDIVRRESSKGGEARIAPMTPEEIDAKAVKVSTDIADYLERANKLLQKIGHDTVSVSVDEVREVARAYYTGLEAERAAKDALKTATNEQKAIAAKILAFDDIQMQMAAAVEAKDWAKLAELTAMQAAAAESAA